MDPRHLMQLSVILDKGSVTAAAQHLRLTQPTLTRNMGALEMQAGGLLFHRSRFGVRSTPLGESLARIGRSVEHQMQVAKESVARHRIGLHSLLRVGVGPLIGMGLMPTLGEAILRESPHLALSVTTARPQLVLDQLVDGDQDVVLAPALYAQIPPGIERVLLAEDEISIFCGPGHPLARVTSPNAEQLSACEWTNVGTASPFQNAELEMLARSGIRRVRTQFATVGDASILMQVLMRGGHLAVLPRVPVRLMAQSFPLVEIRPPGGTARRDLYIWSRSGLSDDRNVLALKKIALALVKPKRARGRRSDEIRRLPADTH